MASVIRRTPVRTRAATFSNLSRIEPQLALPKRVGARPIRREAQSST